MKAIRRTDGKVIEVDPAPYFNMKTDEEYRRCLSDGKYYKLSDLDFSVDEAKESEGEVLSGWVARDKRDNTLNLHAEEPYRTQSAYQQGDEPDWWESACASFLPLDKGLFPDLTWDSEPIEVEITIKPKKKSSINMTDEQIEKAARDYVSFEKGGKCYPNYATECACRRAFIDGARDALSHQWISVEERLPPSTCLLMCINAREDKAYALCVYIRGRFMIYDHTLSYKREFYPTHWLKVPQLNPEKKSI